MPSALATLAAELILEQGPLPLNQIHALALEREITRSRTSSSLRQSLSGPAFVLRPDGRYDTAARLLQGSCFTTRPRRLPRDGVLWLSRDVDPLLALNRARLPLRGGGEVSPGAGDTPTWVGPAGWLPAVPAGELLALSWNGSALEVSPAASVPAADAEGVADVRKLLASHASARHRDRWPYAAASSLTAVVLSALLEDPTLFAAPLPPLSELLPLPEDLRPLLDDAPRAEREGYEVLQLPVPRRVHRELQRRADLLGDHLPDYAAMLLGAAADRLLPSGRPRYDPYSPYDDVYDDNVVSPARWAR
jgi:hypothetical protein